MVVPTAAPNMIPTRDPPNSEERHTRLRGRWLLLARALWFIIVLLTLGLYLLSIPLQIAHLQTLCTETLCQFGQITAANVQELQQMGLSLNFYTIYNVARNTIQFLVFIAVAAIIFWRKSNDWFSMYVALALALFGIGFSEALLVVAEQNPTFSVPVLVLNGIGGTMLGVFFYLFPDGRFVPRWTRWFIPFVAAREFAAVFSPASPIVNVAFMVELATFLFAQVYRYRRASGAVQRQQTKWFVYGASVVILGLVGVTLFLTLASLSSQPLSVMVSLVGYTAASFFILLIPLSIMMAILRYRLWDIDILINRTLVYIPLTAILAGVFAGSITLSQKLFVALTRQTSDAATVLTTLIVVALFDPLKTALQSLVNKRFKEAPDPTKELNAFGDRVRSVIQIIDAHQITRGLLEQAIKSFDAVSGAVYLRRDGQLELVQAYGDWNGDSQLSLALESQGQGWGMLHLGARRNGLEYTKNDHAVLERNASLVAQAIALARRTQ